MPANAAAASLLDQRDAAIDQLAKLMDIRVVPGNGNEVDVFTSSGLQLAGTMASTLSFNSHGTLIANSQWNADPTKSGVGTITLTGTHDPRVSGLQDGDKEMQTNPFARDRGLTPPPLQFYSIELTALEGGNIAVGIGATFCETSDDKQFVITHAYPVDHAAPVRLGAGAARASRMAASALLPARRAVATMEQRSA
jgi:hypothetical protein